MFDLNGKLALVTGASRGIGRAVALKLAEAGADVIVHAKSNLEKLKETAETIRKSGKKAYMACCDASDIHEVDTMFERIRREFGSIDIMVNNAAVLSREPFLEISVDEWDRIMETNVRGYFLCGQNAARLMAGKKSGRILNISSISQYAAAHNRLSYCVSKAAIGMLTKGMALELAAYGITVNAILPGSIHTDFNSDVLSDPAYYNDCKSGIPLGRLGKPEDIAGAAVMLASDEAAYITGAEIVIDGGKTIY